MAVPKSKQELFGIAINDASPKSPPIDADCVALMDTAASNILKKVSLTTLKAFLTTYFDTQYSGSDEAYGSGWNASLAVPTKNAVYDKIESLLLASGTYTPTRSAEVNMDGNVTMSEAQYLRVGNTVTVSGRFTADPATTATPTSFEMTLPVASNIGAIEDVSGTAFCGGIAAMGAGVSGSVANNTAVVSWVSSDITSQIWSYQYSYQII